MSPARNMRQKAKYSSSVAGFDGWVAVRGLSAIRERSGSVEYVENENGIII